ncbi:helix-turn-helix domain-containing protein [Niallia sp. JL1B1071]|uniref:helix-turn-helix domain-containing protein n=1 Tax=Niallia tiangongensis TaxID=3237105 RepID=UPI0037DC8C57
MSNELYKSDIYKTILGKHIRNKRKWKDKSIQQLAEDTGFSINHINNIELGHSQPATGLFHAICDVLKIDATAFLKEVKEEVELLMPEEQ